MKTIIRKSIGYLLLIHLFPFAFLLVWNFSSDRVKDNWYIPFCAGYLVDAAILVLMGLMILISALLED